MLRSAMLVRSAVSDSVTPRTVALQAPLSMGILQARILEWVTMPSSRGSSQPRDQIQVSCITGGPYMQSLFASQKLAHHPQKRELRPWEEERGNGGQTAPV